MPLTMARATIRRGPRGRLEIWRDPPRADGPRVIAQPTFMSFFRSLKFQVTIALTLVLALIIGGAVWQVTRYQRRALDSLSHDQAELMADAVESWLASLMLQHRGTELQAYVENYVIQKDIVDLKVVRMDGTVAVASDPDETGNQVTGQVCNGGGTCETAA